MRLIRRWRKNQPNNILVVNAQLIRSIVNDNLDFSVPSSLYDYVYELDDETLDWLGEKIIDDYELWDALTPIIIEYVTSLKFTQVLDQGGIDYDD
jgi:hypothetical protein